MFTSTQALMVFKNIETRTHKGMLIKFSEAFIKTDLIPANFGKMLNFVFEKRQLCDYNPETIIAKEDAELVLANARLFLDMVKEQVK